MSISSRLAVASLVAGFAVSNASAALVVSEVHPTGSSTAAYGSDWFELTNTGPAAITVTGLAVDDSSNAFGTALALNGVSTLAVGESAVFLESASGAAIPAFLAAWFGTTPPAGLQVGFYSGSGIGLSSGGDAVNIFDSTGVALAGVTFGAATTGVTFDNAAGLNGVAISTLSVVGTNGAFTSATGGEVGSPGTTAVPEPAALGLALMAGVGLIARRRRA